MVERVYAPDRGDVVWVNFNPVRGHEQKGRRPALVVSPKLYNTKTHLALVCPITLSRKGYPFEVEINAGKKVAGAVLTDQVRAIDWKERRVTYIARADSQTVSEVREKLLNLIQ